MSFNKRMLSAGAADLVPSENFKTVIYTGDGNAGRAVTVGFQPDYVWIKARSNTNSWAGTDSTRGVNAILSSNATAGESTFDSSWRSSYGQIASFTSTGFTVNAGSSSGNFNTNGTTYAAYCWKANGGTTSSNGDGNITSTVQVNTDAGFSIVKYSGTGSNVQVGHGLGAAPTIVIFKNLTDSVNWYVWTTATGSLIRLEGLNTTSAAVTSGLGTTLGASTIDFTNTSDFSTSGKDYIMYCFLDIDAYSKFGSYTGNGSDNGPIVETGFEPAFLMIKNTSSTESGGADWLVYDNVRSTTNPRDKRLYASASYQEAQNDNYDLDFLSNGFQIKSGTSNYGFNNNGDTYIYMAFATDPDEEAPALANSFNVEIYNGTKTNEQSITGFGFDPNLIWLKNRDASDNWSIFDTNRGPTALLQVNDSGAEQAFGAGAFNFVTDGFSVANTGQANESGDDFLAYAWQANDNEPTYNTNGSINSIVDVNANAGFSIVSYTGTGSNGTVAHGLSSAPDMIIFKNRDASASWLVYHTGIGNEKAMYLETTGAPTDSNAFFQDTSPTSTVFSVGTHADPNGNTNRIIAYCWHSVTGYSSFGSYTGNGSAGQAITTGFKPDWVLIRSTVGTANWTLYDTRRERGVNQFMQPNNNDPQEEHIGNDNPHVTMTSTGFTFTSDGSSQGGNSNGNLYIYAAFKQNVTSNTTLANSFKTLTWTGNGSNNRDVTGVGFRPDLVWVKRRNSSEPHAVYDTVRGANKQLEANDTDAEATNSGSYLGLYNFASDGFTLGNNGGTNGNSNTYVGWCWKAGNTWQHNVNGTIDCTVNANTANGFSVIKYRGTGSNATVGHGLSGAPEFVIAKNLSSSSAWAVYHSGIGATKYLALNETTAEQTASNVWNDTAPTSTTVSIGTWSPLNADGDEHIMYAWDGVSGFSKFGTYTGNSSTGHSITGLGFQPDFVMIKRVDSNCSNSAFWFMFDSERGAQNYLRATGDNAESTGADATLTSFDNDGFTVGNDGCLNTGTMVYVAFKAN